MNDTATPRQQALDALTHRVHECSTAGCETLIATGTHCRRHAVLPPEGSWAIAARLRDEIGGER